MAELAVELAGLKVVKRNGEIVNFDELRIRNAIAKALRATKNDLPQDRIDSMTAEIAEEIRIRFIEFFPNVENIQDLVEKRLMQAGLYEVAKSYILYRAERQKARNEQKQLIAERSLNGKLTVKKNDGKIALFDLREVRSAIALHSKGYENDISPDSIITELVRNIYDGAPTSEIEKALILTVASFIERDPAYNALAARLFIQKIFKEITDTATDDCNGEKADSARKQDIASRNRRYREAFIKGLKEGVTAGILDKRMLEYDLEALSEALDPSRDDLLQYIGIQTLYERYLIKVGSKRVELPQSFWMRVAMGLALNEQDKDSKAKEFYGLISSLRFVPSTPTLFHSGSTHPQLSSCYLTTIKDDLAHIFKSLGDNAQLSKWSGGLGNDWTNLRAIGAQIKSNNVESQGVIPFLKIANDITVAINRSGKRRGATCAYLEAWHLDIEDFLDLRKNTGDERRRTHDMNTANWIPDLFIKRVIADQPWTLFSPDEVPDLHEIYGRKFEQRYEGYEHAAREGRMRRWKEVSARKLWRRMLSMLFETGHPWMTFKDACNIRSPQDHCGVIHSSNLCTEITLNTSPEETSVCNLGSVNLPKHIIEGKLDEEALAQTIKTAIRMLDNVIDLNYYPTVEAKNSNLRHRPIGLGIMGFQDALFMLDIGFESEEAVDFADSSMESISYYAIKASSELAAECGSYQSFKGSKWSRGIFPLDTLDLHEKERGVRIEVSRTARKDWDSLKKQVKEQGMRNSNVMAIAPTATISNIAGCYPCIEPIFKNLYVKSNISGEFTVVNSYLVTDLKRLGMWNQEMLEQLKYYDGNVQLIAGIPQKIKDKYKEAFEISSRAAILMTAYRGKWIDQSQSHNVFMNTTSGTEISETYLYAWAMGLKTTYYLRTMAASQIEKSTLDAGKYGFTQKRDHSSAAEKPQQAVMSESMLSQPALSQPEIKLCKIEDPSCEACQ